MSTVHILNGAFTRRSSGLGSMANVVPYLESHGLEVAPHIYGWVDPINVREANQQIAEQIARVCQPGDVLMGFSNSGLIVHDAIEAGAQPCAAVVLQPALRRDTQWPDGEYRVLCTFNRGDWVVQLSRSWGRLVQRTGVEWHGWGAAGRHGFTHPDPRITNWDTHPITGHRGPTQASEVLAPVARWTKSQIALAQRAGEAA